MTPRYNPEFLFSVIESSIESECFFCDELITPGIDYWSTIITIPGKGQIMNTHNPCFEQLAWSMMNFVFAHAGETEDLPVN